MSRGMKDAGNIALTNTDKIVAILTGLIPSMIKVVMVVVEMIRTSLLLWMVQMVIRKKRT